MCFHRVNDSLKYQKSFKIIMQKEQMENYVQNRF